MWSKIIEILVMSVKKTADVSKLFLAIFERTYDIVYVFTTFCGCSMPLSEVMTDGAIFHFPV